MAAGPPGDVIAAVTEDELHCEDVVIPDQVARLNILELHRLLYHMPDLPVDVRAAATTAWASRPREQPVYPVCDDDGLLS